MAPQPSNSAGTPVTAKPSVRTIGSGRIRLHGTDIESMVIPYTLYKMQWVTDCFEAMAPPLRVRMLDWFKPLGLAPLLTRRANRPVGRSGYIEVWE